MLMKQEKEIEKCECLVAGLLSCGGTRSRDFFFLSSLYNSLLIAPMLEHFLHFPAAQSNGDNAPQRPHRVKIKVMLFYKFRSIERIAER